MTSISTVATIAGRRGSFPVGTDNPNKGSQACLSSPIMPIVNGVVQAGYTLVTTDAKDNGMDWQFTGTGGAGIKRYRFPNETPNPFPNPTGVGADYALIVREDQNTPINGLIDLEMPVLGFRGQIPVHSIPSTTWSTYTFFFDSANSAINVYNDATKTWQMGWMSFNASSTFTAATARNATAAFSLFTNPTLWVAGTFTTYRSTATASTAAPGGFIYINLSVAAGQLVSPVAGSIFILPNITAAAATTNIDITALCPIADQGINYATFSLGNYPVAFAVGPNNAITGGAGGASRWGYIRFTSSTAAIYVTSQFVSYNISYPDLDNSVGGGRVNTISVTNDVEIFVIGGSYTSITQGGVAVQKTYANGYNQAAAVIIQWYPTAATYGWIGGNAILAINCRPWRGTVEQSNYSSDGYFYFSGNFLSAPIELATVITEDSSPPGPILADPNWLTGPVTVDVEQSLYTQYTTNVTLNAPTTSGKTLAGPLYTVDILVPLATQTAINNGAGLIFDFQINNSPSLNPLVAIADANYGAAATYSLPPGQTVTGSFYATNIDKLYWSWFGLYSQYANANPTTTRLQIYFNATMYFDTQQAQTWIESWNTIEIYGGFLSNKLNSDEPLSAFPSGQTFVQWALTNVAGDTLALGSQLPVGITPSFYVFGYQKAVAGTAQALTQSESGAGNFGFVDVTGTRATARFSTLETVVTVPGGNNTLYCSYTVTNMPITEQLFLQYQPPQTVPSPLPANNTGVLSFKILKQESTFSIVNSAFVGKFAPQLPRQIPRLLGGPPNQPTFNQYGLNINKIYKTGWAYNALPNALGLGIYDGDVSTVLGNYGIITNNANPGTGALSYQTATNQVDSTAVRISAVNNSGTDVTLTLSQLRIGDTFVLSQAPPYVQVFLVTALPTLIVGVPNYYNIPVVALNNFGNATLTILASADLFSTKGTSPNILDANLGAYLLNGSNNLTQLFFSSFVETGKAWKFVSENLSNSLTFQSNINLAAPTTQQTVNANRVAFNSNYSSVLLGPSDRAVGEWVVVTTEGNVGFSKV